MTTTTLVDDVKNTILPPSLYNIQYPNCGRGMFSLRQPFKDMNTAINPTEERQASSRKLISAAAQTTDVEQVLPRQPSKRNAEIQCSLLTPNTRHDMAVQTKIDRQQSAVTDENDITPVYRHKKKLQRPEQHHKIYEIWDVESASLEAVPIDQTIKHKELRLKQVKNTKPIFDYYDEEEESDYDSERIVYPRRPRKTVKKTYLPPHVRMICVRDDANRASC